MATLTAERLPDLDTIKMFMGQISKSLDEEGLKSYLSEHGEVYEVKVIRDKITGVSRGCAFVTFYTRKDALTAQMALHNLVTMSGLIHPIQMTPADGPSQRSTVEDRRLFIGKIHRTITEDELKEAFAPFGEMEDLYIVREMTEPKLCKGCAFVTFTRKESAQDAIRNLHMTKVFRNHDDPIVVKIADTQKEKEKKKNMSNQKFSQSPFQLTPGTVGLGLNQLNSSTLPNMGLNAPLQNAQLQQFLLAALATSPLLQSNSAAGLAGTSPGAAQQLQQLQQQQQQQPQQLQMATSTPNPVAPTSTGGIGAAFSPHQSSNFQQSMAQGTAYSISANAMMSMLGQTYGSEVLASYGLQNAFAAYNQQEATSSSFYQTQTGNKTKGPEGANLFIYHLPLECRDHDLYQMFSPWGNVLSATVFMDKKKNESKCFGFVSYDSASSADVAIRQMNGFQVGNKRLKVSLKTNNPKPY